MNRFSAIATALLVSGGAVAQDVQREFIHVEGDVYLFRNNFHLSLIVPTTEGTVRVDPINAAASTWVNDNLGEIGAPPISHLIWSHSHEDHSSGGEVYADVVTIAHEDAPEQIAGATPSMRVGDSHVLELGGKSFELTNLGSGHDNHMLAVVVRPENVGFIVDVAAPRRLPFRTFGGANVDDWVNQIKAAQALDFEIFAPGHGNVGTHGDLEDVLGYMADLKAGVLEGLNAGKTVDDIKSDLTLAQYADWLSYEQWRTENIEGMVDFLKASGQAD